MNFITCASYYATGSSAVTDLINECDNVHSMGDYEFRFIQDPDGIRDLEYNLVENNHRHNSGYAIRRYLENVKFLNGSKLIKKYNRFFGNAWISLSESYINDLVDLCYIGSWHQELRDKGKLAYFLERSVNKIMHYVFHMHSERNFNLFLRKNKEYGAFPGEKFYEITKKYIEKLFNVANKDNKQFIMADQLVPASNTSQYLKYFDNIKVICVDRDPRDIYIAEREIYHGTIVPRNVDDFCKWFKITRAHKQYELDDPKQVMRIRFEDLIYKYDNTQNRILEFCGISKEHHVKQFKLFDPSISKKNTQLFKLYPHYGKDILKIEHVLKGELYNFKG